MFFEHVHHLDHLVREKAFATDEHSIHLCLPCHTRQKSAFHRSPVENRYSLCRLRIKSFRKNFSEQNFHLKYLMRRGQLIASDRPARFIGEDYFFCLKFRKARKNVSYLFLQNSPCFILISFSTRFAYTDDRDKKIFQRSQYFLLHDLVRFAHQGPAFAVTNETIIDTGILQHDWRDFTGKCTTLLPEHILCSPFYALRQMGKSFKIEERRTENTFHVLIRPPLRLSLQNRQILRNLFS